MLHELSCHNFEKPFRTIINVETLKKLALLPYLYDYITQNKVVS
jgi:hypothetical protein